MLRILSSQIFYIPRTSLFSNIKYVLRSAGRSFYSDEELKITQFKLYTERYRKENYLNVDEFWAQKQKLLDSNESGVLSFIDCKNMLCLFDGESTRLQLIYKLVKQFTPEEDQKGVGAVIMRRLYDLDLREEMLKICQDKDLEYICPENYGLLLSVDSLYKNKQFEDILHFCKVLGINTFNNYTALIVFAAAYKLNTPEALQKALVFYNEKAATGFRFDGHMLGLMCLLALKHNQINTAKTILSYSYADSIIYGNMQMLTTLYSGSLEEALSRLKANLASHNREIVYYKDIFEYFDKAMVDNPLRDDYSSLKSNLQKKGLIETKSLEDKLLTNDVDFEVTIRKKKTRKYEYF